MRGRIVTLTILVALLAACGGTPPTPTPPTPPTPAFQRFKADDVISAFQNAGLTVTDVKVAQRAPNSIAPNVAIETKEFTIPSIASPGGQVLIFKEQADLEAMRTWFARFPDLAPYVYVGSNAMVQLNGSLPKVEAERFKAVIEDMR